MLRTMISKLSFGKRLLVALLAGVLLFGFGTDVQAQTKKKSSKPKTTQTSKSKTGKGKGTAKTDGSSKKAAAKEAEPETPKSTDLELPYKSNDCLFAVTLQPDVPFGPTTPPQGGGRVQEVVADKAHPNLFEREHNTVWYKIKAPYNGMLEISIVQNNAWDDYDFLVYKNTGDYFPNQVMLNKVEPLAVNMGSVDSVGLGLTALKSGAKGKGKGGDAATAPKAKPKTDLPNIEMTTGLQPHIGMSIDAKDKMLTKKQFGGFIKSIQVRMGEEYYIVLDNVTPGGQGHTITVSVHADAYEPLVLFYDRRSRRYVGVDLMILERGEGGIERTMVKNQDYRGGKVKFVPGFSYTLYAKKEGYFSIYREFAARDLMMLDTMMVYNMERIERGSSFQIKDIYFEDGEATLIANYDSVLSDYVAMFRNHPEVRFMIKGYVQSYGVNAENDMLLSLERAKSVKQYFVDNGISPDRMVTTGMSRNEIRRLAAAALSKGGGFSGVKIELIILASRQPQ